MWLVNFGHVALFSTYELTLGGGKHVDETNHAHVVSLRYNLITSSKESDPLSIGFHRSCDRRQKGLTKKQKYLM